MKWLIEKSRYVAYIGVLVLFVCSLTAYILGIYKTFKTVIAIALNEVKDDFALIALFDCLDTVLIATALLVISISLYELFIGELKVPDWMLVRNLSELKAKFTFVIIPVMSVKFLQKLLQGENALDTLYYGVGVALVTAALAAFNYVSEKEKMDELEIHPEEEETRAQDL
ncbi:MAG: YqhA family protein [Acidobacteriota bacterium]|nr:YqhA family protein [Acidobacteriota bacterium]